MNGIKKGNGYLSLNDSSEKGLSIHDLTDGSFCLFKNSRPMILNKQDINNLILLLNEVKENNYKIERNTSIESDELHTEHWENMIASIKNYKKNNK
ncbi:hypothetical protein [Bacillus cereus group sp. BfR-BA-01328]|uniref:hypothetical protein n=1 Tax=Bacillus cereus group sp. BfR-BA-01328 TaxID=2920304 RepID=UPI001F57BFE0